MHWLQGYNAALLRQRLGEAVPAILLPAPLPPAQLALGLDAAAPHTPAQAVQAPGGLTSPPEPMPQTEHESELFTFDGDAASCASDAASNADTEDFAEWAHEFALAPPMDATDEPAPAPAADPVLEGLPAQEPAPPVLCEDHLGAACTRFIAAPAISLISTVEACVPAAAPVRGSLSISDCMLCYPACTVTPDHGNPGLIIPAVEACSVFLPRTRIILCTRAGDRHRRHHHRRGRGLARRRCSLAGALCVRCLLPPAAAARAPEPQ